MPRCVEVGCNNNGNHSFPEDIQIKKLWGNSRLCSNHFTEADFQSISSATGLPPLHRFLKKDCNSNGFCVEQNSNCKGAAIFSL
ncbi:unnamed protein product [Pieris brassicae]|uniref:Uncharacterized protein n=1 Tax=Pieris brassicae TaxID=7116 RepID=A0A9P0TIC3_PIEBR|nr:unnamed protein product [Pieris brassicae]